MTVDRHRGVLAGMAGAGLLVGALAVGMHGSDAPGVPQPAGRPDESPVPARVTAADAGPAARAVPAEAAPQAVAPAPAAVATLVLGVPPTLDVGEQAELDVEVTAHPSVHELAFTLRFDPDRLQARSAEPGDWAPGSAFSATFTAEVTEAADRLTIVSTGAGAPRAGGRVARVQFQAVAAGASEVVIGEARARDVQGRPLPVALSGARRVVQVEAVPR